MSKKQSEKLANLAHQVMRHKRLYYAGKPEISDAEYDALEEALRRLAPEHPALAFVGSDPTATTRKVEHAIPMLSLDKTYVEADLLSWVDDHPVMGMLKIDGNSLSLVYQDGDLVLAKTRGNGRVGEDVTEKARWVADIPQTIDAKGAVEVRGELFCTETNFIHITEEFLALGLEKPTSPRNIVAGLLGRKSHYNLTRYFNFHGFDYLQLVEKNSRLKTEEQKFEKLAQYGFTLPDPRLCHTKEEVQEYLQHTLVVMEQGEMGIDGAVFSYNNLALHNELGNTAHHPRYKISFKWQGKTAQSKIEDIVWYTSRLGIVTPVAVIEPVFLSGATITNVTLHNAAHVKMFNLKRGDKIEIVRSGEVIPKFLFVVEEAKGSCDLPRTCSVCQTPLVFDDVRLVCPNTSACPAQQLGMIVNWIRCVEIDDLSEKRLQQMIDANLVQSIPDLYRLREKDLLTLPQTKETLAKKLLANIEKSREVPLARFLNGLGISGTGLTSWEKLLENFPGLEEVQAASPADIVGVEGFAEKSAEQIVSGLKERKKLIKELLNVGVKPQFVKRRSGGRLEGKQIVITGALSLPRDDIEEMIKAAGGKPGSSVSKNTFAVVTEDPTSESSKMRKARDLGVQIWSEKDLMRFLGP